LDFLYLPGEKLLPLSVYRCHLVKDIAILFNGKVLAAPRVQEEIKNGKCLISGNYTESEIKRLKAAFE